MRASLITTFIFGVVTAVTIPTGADAAEHVSESEHAEARGHNIVGVRLLGGPAFTHHEVERMLGIGVTAERAFFHHHLEVELVGAYLLHGEHPGVGGELVLKVPWAVSRAFDLYVGAGGIVEHFGEGTDGGLVFDVGGRAWTTEHWGVGLEFDYVQLLTHRSTAFEGALDVMYRF